MTKDDRYYPLPKNLRLGFSKIHDIGLFAKKKIKQGEELGMTHVQIGKHLIRTPLGGFINHSDDPNCTKSMFRVSNVDDAFIKMDYKVWRLFTLNNIKKDEELTLTYTFYKV